MFNYRFRIIEHSGAGSQRELVAVGMVVAAHLGGARGRGGGARGGHTHPRGVRGALAARGCCVQGQCV